MPSRKKLKVHLTLDADGEKVLCGCEFALRVTKDPKQLTCRSCIVRYEENPCP